MAEPQDNINPSHYQKGDIEVIDFIIDQDMDYFTASAVKYYVDGEINIEVRGKLMI